jgi:hypothetical protein
MALEQPSGVPDELWARVLAHQRQAIEHEERKERLLSSIKTGADKILDRAFANLRNDEVELKARQEALASEMRKYGVDI